MVSKNKTNKGKFGKDPKRDPKKSGSKGGKKSRLSVKEKMKIKVRHLQNLNYDTYEKFMTGKGKINNIDEIAKTILAGEEGIEYFIKQDVSLMKALSDHILSEKDMNMLDKMDILQKRSYFIKNMKEAMYGTKSRQEVKTNLNISSEESIKEINDIYERSKKRFEKDKKSTRNNKR